MIRGNKWLWLSWVIAASLVREPAPTVRTKSGLVRGRSDPGGTFYQYFGIPYGTVNDTNRFQAPIPPPKWDGIFEAINENTRCPQKIIGSFVSGNQDCLKLNVYSPVKRQPNKLLPVMVYIHRGGFLEGTGSGFLYGGDFFVEYNVVFVGVSYRLNIEGFLCLGIKEAPGNAGLKDQLAALRWIKENIKSFGGDPDNITLFGESAGAVSTSYLILSPAAKGLFHKAILQSGSTLAPWALQQDPIETASALAKELGYNTSDPHELYRLFTNFRIDTLINAIRYSKHKNFITADVLFCPCIEREIQDVEAIITRHPTDIIISGNYSKVPMIIGFNDKEGIYLVAKDYGNRVKEINLADTLHKSLNFLSDSDRNTTINKLADHYFSFPKENIVEDVVDLYSDFNIKVPSAVEAQLYSKTTDQPMFYYLFKYSGYINLPKMISLFWFTQGASHADELFYMFKPHSFPLPHRFLERKMLNRMLTLWTNFAKYSEPTPHTSALLPVRWRAARADLGSAPQALIIDTRLSTGPLWDETTLRLWNDTYSKFRRKRYGFS